MTRSILIVILCLIPSVANAGSEVKITGIWRRPDQTLALCEEYLRKGSPPHRTFQLASGDSIRLSSGTNEMTIIDLDVERGVIRTEVGGSNQLFQIKSNFDGDQPGLALESASTGHVLFIYSRIQNKSLLPHPDLSKKTYTFATNFLSDTAAVEILRQKLSSNGIQIVKFSDNIELAVPERFAGQKIDFTSFVSPKKEEQDYEPVQVELFSAPISQVADICVAFVGGEYDHKIPVSLTRDAGLTFTLVAPASRQELAHAFQQWFLWHGQRLVVADSGKFILTPAR